MRDVVTEPHRLIVVHNVWSEPSDEGDPVECEEWDYEVEHPVTCTKVVTVRCVFGKAPDVMVDWDCSMSYELSNAGLPGGPEEWGVGEFLIEAYCERSGGSGEMWVEWDSGIRSCSDDAVFVPAN